MSSVFEKGDAIFAESDGTLVWGIRQNVKSRNSVRFSVPGHDLKKKFYFWSAEILNQDPEVDVSGLLIRDYGGRFYDVHFIKYNPDFLYF